LEHCSQSPSDDVLVHPFWQHVPQWAADVPHQPYWEQQFPGKPMLAHVLAGPHWPVKAAHDPVPDGAGGGPLPVILREQMVRYELLWVMETWNIY
jgi:hypothetical protein